MSKSNSGHYSGTSGANKALVDELISSGEKCTPSKIIGITKDTSGKIIWLEEGNKRSGMQHIIDRHSSEFEKIGVSSQELVNYIMEAVTQDNIVGMQRSRFIYEFVYEGNTHRIAVEIGSNGYIVSANPKSMRGVK